MSDCITIHKLYTHLLNLGYREIMKPDGRLLSLHKANDEELVYFGEKLSREGGHLSQTELATLQDCLEEARG